MIWSFYNTNSMSEQEFTRYYRRMDSSKKERVNRTIDETAKKSIVAADMLARSLIAEWFGIHADSVKFSIDEHGKPHATDLPIHFSVSHSKGIVVCAVSDKPIGVDIEYFRTINPKIIHRYCNDDELTYLNADPHTNFFELWTAKEAYAKLIGTGLAGMGNVHLSEIKDRLHTVQTKDYFLTFAI